MNKKIKKQTSGKCNVKKRKLVTLSLDEYVKIDIQAHRLVKACIKMALFLETLPKEEGGILTETSEDQGVYYDIPVTELKTALKVVSIIEERLSGKRIPFTR